MLAPLPPHTEPGPPGPSQPRTGRGQRRGGRGSRRTGHGLRRGPLAVLLVVAAVGLATSGALGGIALADRDPVPAACCADPAPSGGPAGGAMPTAAPGARPAPLPTCLIGSWLVRSETVSQLFYTGDEPRPFSSSGRRYEFRPDGTVFESATNVTYTSSDGRFRKVLNGTREYTWTATDTTITYLVLRRTSMIWQFFDGGRRVDSLSDKVRTLNETDAYTCSAQQVVESSAGYRATWERTGPYGIYG